MTVNVYTPALPMTAGATYTFPFALLSQADAKIFKSSPSAFQAGDFVLFTKTAGVWARIGNLSTTPTLIGISTRVLLMTILNTEIPAGTQAMAVLCNDQAGAEWCDLLVVKDVDAPVAVGTSDLTLANITGSALFAGITSLASWLRGLYRKDAMDAAAKLEVNSGGGAYNEATDSNEALRDNIGASGSGLTLLPNVTVGALTVAALAQFANTDTLLIAAVPGSVADLAQCNSSGFPAGAITFTYTVLDPGALPVGNIAVWISTDNPVGGNPVNVVWSGMSDAFGVIRDNQGNLPHLNAGVYYFWASGPGYTPAAWPDSETVS